MTLLVATVFLMVLIELISSRVKKLERRVKAVEQLDVSRVRHMTKLVDLLQDYITLTERLREQIKVLEKQTKDFRPKQKRKGRKFK